MYGEKCPWSEFQLHGDNGLSKRSQLSGVRQRKKKGKRQGWGERKKERQKRLKKKEREKS